MVQGRGGGPGVKEGRGGGGQGWCKVGVVRPKRLSVLTCDRRSGELGLRLGSGFGFGLALALRQPLYVAAAAERGRQHELPLEQHRHAEQAAQELACPRRGSNA